MGCWRISFGVVRSSSNASSSSPVREVKTVHHHLIDLTITMENSLNPSIRRNFDFPALRILRLGPLIIAEEHWEEHVHLLPHFSNIQWLSFMAGLDRRKTLQCARIVELLRCTENVEGLELCPGIWYPDILEALTVTTPAPTSTISLPSESAPTPAPTAITLPPLLPKLCSFSINLGVKPQGVQAFWESIEGDYDRYPRRFSSQALVKMIQSWWAPFGGGSLVEKGAFTSRNCTYTSRKRMNISAMKFTASSQSAWMMD
jgi:hypothetical protein